MSGDRAREIDPLAASGERVLGDPLDGLAGAPLELDAAPAAPTTLASVAPLDPARVAAIADYGPPPRGLLGAVPYAALVLSRRRALTIALADLRRLAKAAERDRDEAQIALGRALHAERSPALRQELAAADEAARIAGKREGELRASRDAAEAQRASLDAKLEEAARAAAPYRDRETKLATQMNVRDTDLRRAQARLSRVEIELRNLAGHTDGGRRGLLEAERDARRAEVEAAQAQIDALAPKLAEARRELAVMLSAQNDLTQQRRAVEAAEARAEHAHAGAASDAERSYRAAASALAVRALELGIAEDAAPDEAKAARRMQAALHTRNHEIALHQAALSAYDARAFQRGAALLGGALLVVAITLLFVILR